MAEESLEADLWPGVPTDQSLQPGSWLSIEVNDMDAFEAVPTNVDNYGFIYLHSVHGEHSPRRRSVVRCIAAFGWPASARLEKCCDVLLEGAPGCLVLD